MRRCVEEVGDWGAFYRPLTHHLPLGGTATAVIGARFAKKPFSFTPFQFEGQAATRVQILRHLKIYKRTYFLQGKLGCYANEIGRAHV